MGTYRKEWDCCGSVTETQAWEPETCPFCTPAPVAQEPQKARPNPFDTREPQKARPDPPDLGGSAVAQETRDRFAIAMLPYVPSQHAGNSMDRETHPRYLARRAYEYADAMIRQRTKPV